MKRGFLIFCVAWLAVIAMNGCATQDTPWVYREKDGMPPTKTSESHLKWWE